MPLSEQDLFGGVGGWLHRTSRLAQVSLTFSEAFDLFLHDT